MDRLTKAGAEMKLPGAESAIVDEQKVREYLLGESHPVGRFKAAFFTSLGYPTADWEVLARDLATHSVEGEASEADRNDYGTKYEVRGILEGPKGKRAQVVSVWILLDGEAAPRLVTAYPG